MAILYKISNPCHRPPLWVGSPTNGLGGEIDMRKARVIYRLDVQALVAARAWRYPGMCRALKFSALGSCKRLQLSARICSASRSLSQIRTPTVLDSREWRENGSAQILTEPHGNHLCFPGPCKQLGFCERTVHYRPANIGPRR